MRQRSIGDYAIFFGSMVIVGWLTWVVLSVTVNVS
jgi:hypothetical protein